MRSIASLLSLAAPSSAPESGAPAGYRTLFFERSQKAADRNAPLARTCSAALARGSFISDFLTTTSVSAARTRSSHTRWGYELLPLSLRIDFRTVPYAHIPVTVCLRRQGAAGQPAPPPFASCTCARRGRCSGRPARVGYYLDRRCPQQSLSSSWKTPL